MYASGCPNCLEYIAGVHVQLILMTIIIYTACMASHMHADVMCVCTMLAMCT